MHPPGPGTPPPGRGTPPGPGTPPLEPGTPLGPGSLLDQVHPPDQVHPARIRYTPLGPGMPPQDQVHSHTPPDQVHPPGRRLLLPTVRILLECILVGNNFVNSWVNLERNYTENRKTPIDNYFFTWSQQKINIDGKLFAQV